MGYETIGNDFRHGMRLLWEEGRVDAREVRLNAATLVSSFALYNLHRQTMFPAWSAAYYLRTFTNPYTGGLVPLVVDNSLPDGSVWVLPGERYE